MRDNTEAAPQGIVLRGQAHESAAEAWQAVLARLDALDLSASINVHNSVDAGGRSLQLRVDGAYMDRWAPGFDTLQLCQRLQLDTEHRPADLTREIVVAMLMGPVASEFPSADELISAVRMRHNIVQAARRSRLAFHTSQAERPADCWTYKEDVGFVLLPGASLTTALAKATQPEVSGGLYSFSCYRATEYVMLLGIAQELARCNPPVLERLQAQWTERPIMSGEFHEVFLREQGTMDAPMPPRYFVPGDRIWFRNPDEASANASGFEGSWVIYLGGGLFSNFWNPRQPFTLAAKCLEIYQWRNGCYIDAQGDTRVDEAKVATMVAAARQDAAEHGRIQAVMQRYREPRGVYQNGGCLDTTREFARWVHPGTADLRLPLT